MAEKNFGNLGFSFQQSLIKSIIENKKYGETIIDVLESRYFDNTSFKFIMENVKELFKTYNTIPNAAANVWWITLSETSFTYNLRRIGSDRLFTVHFDLTKTVTNPPAPWGWKD